MRLIETFAYERGPALKGKAKDVEKEIVMALLQFYNTGTLLRVCLPLERITPEGTAILSTKAKF